MSDLTQFTQPKSDQLTADDLISGPISITITDVKTGGSAEQPVSMFFDGDGGKPYRPCKSMTRVLVHGWGKTMPGGRKELDSRDCIGRSLTLYRDPDVKFGDLKVGGIRISHMSHITAEQEMALQATKGRKKAYKVRPLIATKPAEPEPPKTPGEWLLALEADLQAAQHPDAVDEITGRDDVRDALEKYPHKIRERINVMIQAAIKRTAEDAA